MLRTDDAIGDARVASHVLRWQRGDIVQWLGGEDDVEWRKGTLTKSVQRFHTATVVDESGKTCEVPTLKLHRIDP